jgi:hypothetical protein
MGRRALRGVEQLPRSVVAEVTERIDREWLVTSTGRLLHHATPTHGQAMLLAEGGSARLRLSCKLERVASFPDSDQHHLPRCTRCCSTAQIPAGVGSPMLDPACVLALAQVSRWPR